MSETDDGLHRVIKILDETDLSNYLPRLRDDLQVTKLSHFQYVQSNDLERVGLSKPAARRLLAAVKQKQRTNVKKVPALSSSSEPPSSCLISVSSVRLLSTLGSGHYGVVRRGEWNDRPVAVKILRGCNVISDFVREANLMHSLSHPNLIRLHGIVLSEPLMMVTELAPLGSLLCRLHSEPTHFLVTMLVEYGRQIAEGMAYLEQRRFIHRDLAARNVFLVSYEQVKIGDFGLARIMDSGAQLYRPGDVTQGQSIPVAWCAPESLRRQEFSSSSDVWMFAVTLWEIFALGAEQPWNGFTVSEILNALEQRGERLKAPELCPPSIYSLLNKCWSLEPNRRPTFATVVSLLNGCRPMQCRVARDHKQSTHLTLIRGDLVSVFDQHVDSPICKGQNHRTHQVGSFPRTCLSSITTSDHISWPVRGSFFHTGHSDGAGGRSWGKIDGIDETILNNPIVTPVDGTERDPNVHIVSNVLRLNGQTPPLKEKPLITRPPPPIPKAPPAIIPKNDDQLLIDLTESPPKIIRPIPLPELITNRAVVDTSPSTLSQPRTTNNRTDSHQFVAKVITSVTEQLKDDFPYGKSPLFEKDFTPPLVRRFTVPYPPNPSSYYNFNRQQ